MKILITGGAGFIGHHAARRWLKAGHAVAVLDDYSRPGSALNAAELKADGAEVIPSPVAYASAAVERMHPDIVLHLAGQPAVTTSIENPTLDFLVNGEGTLAVLEAVRKYARDALLIYASTNKVYGRIGAAIHPTTGVPESWPLDFHSPYGCSKGAADSYVKDYARVYGLRTAVARMSCIYGPEQYPLEGHAWLAWFAARVALGAPVTIFGDGRQIRDVLWIEDLLDCYDAMIARPDMASGQVFNIGGGIDRQVTVHDALCRISDALGKEPKITYADARPGDQPVYVSDIRKAMQRLGWAPQIAPEAGIVRLCTWVHAHTGELAELGCGD